MVIRMRISTLPFVESAESQLGWKGIPKEWSNAEQRQGLAEWVIKSHVYRMCRSNRLRPRYVNRGTADKLLNVSSDSGATGGMLGETCNAERQIPNLS